MTALSFQGALMKKSLVLVGAAAVLLAGCVVTPPPPHPHPPPGYGAGPAPGGPSGDRDRDRDNDGVPNRYDRRPNDPYRR